MKKSVIFLLVLIPFFAFSQKEAANWYFGDFSGLDFNTGSPVVLTDGQISTFEGCATISDYQGNLLFYTDGNTVWDNSHNIMSNGTGLLGDSSSSQSAIIVPRPNNPDEYYIFTVDANPNGTDTGNGINYSIVDMSLNGGLGDVTIKNSNILNWAFEKITAIKHDNNNSFWVITFRRDEFYAWHITASGVDPPIITNIGISNTSASRGYLKTSVDGSLIVSANFGNNGTLMLYDFDNSTGIISNEQQLFFDDSNDLPYGVEFSYSGTKLYATTCRISNTDIDGDGFIGDVTGPGRLYQFDLSNGNARTLIEDQNAYTRGALQIALDRKIYRALSTVSGSQQLTSQGTNYLGVINNPENAGMASNYTSNAIDVTIAGTFPTHRVFEGLPPFISSFFTIEIVANDVCFGDATQFLVNSSVPPNSINWDFGDPSSPDNTSTLLEPTHVYSSDGVFTVNADVTTAGITETLTIDVTIYPLPVVNSPVSLTECDDDLDGFMNFDLTQANSLLNTEVPAPTITYFLTEQDALDNINEITNATAFSNQNTTVTNQVWARVENAANCIETAQVELIVDSLTIPSNVTGPFIECDDFADGDTTNGSAIFDFSSATSDFLNAMLPETNLTVNYYENQADALAESNTIDASNYRNTIPNSQDIVVRINNTATGCFGLSSLTLTVQELPEFDIIPATTVCLFGEATTVSVVNPSGNFTYEWQNSSGIEIGTGDNIALDTPGDYTIIATDTTGANCTTTDIVTIVSEPVQPLLGFTRETNIIVTDNTFNNNSITVLLNNLPTSTYQVALDENPFQTELVFENVEAGLHTVTIRDIENCLEARVEVSLIYVPNFFTPNGDGTNDYWQVTGISFQPNSKIYIFDRFGKLIKILNPLSSGWDGYYKGNPLPSTDYWYKVELEDGRILKGHFSLIRR